MAKNNSFTTVFILVIFILSVFSVFYTNLSKDKNTVPYINDGRVSWDNVEGITIISDGYFGRTLEEELIIADKSEVKKIVKLATDADKYEDVSSDESLEGICGIFVDFGNGCVISMYEDVNYGTIDNKMCEIAENEGYFKFPEKFRSEILDILKENEPVK